MITRTCDGSMSAQPLNGKPSFPGSAWERTAEEAPPRLAVAKRPNLSARASPSPWGLDVRVSAPDLSRSGRGRRTNHAFRVPCPPGSETHDFIGWGSCPSAALRKGRGATARGLPPAPSGAGAPPMRRRSTIAAPTPGGSPAPMERRSHPRKCLHQRPNLSARALPSLVSEERRLPGLPEKRTSREDGRGWVADVH